MSKKTENPQNYNDWYGVEERDAGATISVLSILPMLLSAFNVKDSLIGQVMKDLDEKRNLASRGIPDALMNNISKLLSGYDGTKGGGKISCDVAKLPNVMVPLGKKPLKDAQNQKNILSDIMRAGLHGKVWVDLRENTIRLESADGSHQDVIKYDKSGAISFTSVNAMSRIGMSCSRLYDGKNGNYMYGAVATCNGPNFDTGMTTLAKIGGNIGAVVSHARKNIQKFSDFVRSHVSLEGKDAHAAGLIILDHVEGKDFYKNYQRFSSEIVGPTGEFQSYEDFLNMIAKDVQSGKQLKSLAIMSAFCEEAKKLRRPAEDATKIVMYGGPNFFGTIRKQVVPLRKMGFFSEPNDGEDKTRYLVIGVGRDNLGYLKGLRGELSDLKPDESQNVKQKNLFSSRDFANFNDCVVFSDVYLQEDFVRELYPDKFGREGGTGKAKVPVRAFHRCIAVAEHIKSKGSKDFCVKMFLEPNLSEQDYSWLASTFEDCKIELYPGGRGHNFEWYIRAQVQESGAGPTVTAWQKAVIRAARVATVVTLQRIAAEVVHKYVPLSMCEYFAPYTLLRDGEVDPMWVGKTKMKDMLGESLEIGIVRTGMSFSDTFSEEVHCEELSTVHDDSKDDLTESEGEDGEAEFLKEQAAAYTGVEDPDAGGGATQSSQTPPKAKANGAPPRQVHAARKRAPPKRKTEPLMETEEDDDGRF
jgi:hypothetical protein